MTSQLTATLALRRRGQALESCFEFGNVRQGKTEGAFENLAHLVDVHEDAPFSFAVQMVHGELIVAQRIAAIRRGPRGE